MKKALDHLVLKRRRLVLKGTELIFQVLNDSRTVRATVDLTVCVFIEVLQQYMKQTKRSQWPLILNRFIQTTESFSPFPRQPDPSDRWKLILQSYHVNTEDAYVVQLSSLDWTETEDRLMHDYFEGILDICFEEGRQTNNIEFLNISEDIILLLQKMAINETIF